MQSNELNIVVDLNNAFVETGCSLKFHLIEKTPSSVQIQKLQNTVNPSIVCSSFKIIHPFSMSIITLCSEAYHRATLCSERGRFHILPLSSPYYSLGFFHPLERQKIITHKTFPPYYWFGPHHFPLPKSQTYIQQHYLVRILGKGSNSFLLFDETKIQYYWYLHTEKSISLISRLTTK